MAWRRSEAREKQTTKRNKKKTINHNIKGWPRSLTYTATVSLAYLVKSPKAGLASVALQSADATLAMALLRDGIARLT